MLALAIVISSMALPLLFILLFNLLGGSSWDFMDGVWAVFAFILLTIGASAAGTSSGSADTSTPSVRS